MYYRLSNDLVKS